MGYCGPEASNISGLSKVISPSRHTQKSSQSVRACTAHDGAICSKSRKKFPYHGDSPNIRNSARLRSPSPIMAPGTKQWNPNLFVVMLTQLRCLLRNCQAVSNFVLENFVLLYFRFYIYKRDKLIRLTVFRCYEKIRRCAVISPLFGKL